MFPAQKCAAQASGNSYRRGNSLEKQPVKGRQQLAIQQETNA